MNHPRNGRLRAGANIGRGAGDGACGGKSAEHGRNDIGYALADEFHVRVVMVIAHAVRNHSRHEGFDRAQHRDGKSRTQQSVDQIGTKAGNHKVRQAAGIPPKRDPMVSTGSLNNTTAAVPSRKATIAPGIRLETARQKIITSTVPAASAVAV